MVEWRSAGAGLIRHRFVDSPSKQKTECAVFSNSKKSKASNVYFANGERDKTIFFHSRRCRREASPSWPKRLGLDLTAWSSCCPPDNNQPLGGLDGLGDKWRRPKLSLTRMSALQEVGKQLGKPELAVRMGEGHTFSPIAWQDYSEDLWVIFMANHRISIVLNRYGE